MGEGDERSDAAPSHYPIYGGAVESDKFSKGFLRAISNLPTNRIRGLLNPSWVTGFIDAEGTFGVMLQKGSPLIIV